ncbi:CYIR protein [Plasmodium cynomolgi strain B]|uniref:CYIR protein n=1 Tax=Plasmodium cynomolgi (strain B) TaxID=1120755 RepID=K6VJV6_PLACD|nr:CYIR protein [Plasmodium cynomolgi strain B]GAB69712.1 CYIR protein [Plasmodium cynomolgi strain B]
MFYDAMNKVSADVNYYNIKCHNIKVKIKKIGKGNKHVNEMVNRTVKEVTNICKMFITYLLQYALSKISNSNYDQCILLNYWIYTKLYNIFGSKNLPTILDVFAKYEQIWYEIVEKHLDKSQYKKCTPDHSTIGKRDWEKRKKLYDYYVDYDYLLSMAKIKNKIECTYYNKLNEMISLYESFKDVCEPKTDNCPDVFYKCRDKNIESAIKELTCDAEIIEVHPQRADDVEGENIDDFTVEFDTHLDSENSGIGTKVTHSILGAAPVLLTGTVLYRVCTYFVKIYHYVTNL